eukprot:TRINITY_DN91735_c0_g1_i1.p1 TRINITY_DN91735_c0_g1~~TRINITY_DN91735_c0_g1_i1.p1  ORF type:complete len:390 (+),score=104.82 TRINITY_DN91735_c0_g1_i1:102-1271(+)
MNALDDELLRQQGPTAVLRESTVLHQRFDATLELRALGSNASQHYEDAAKTLTAAANHRNGFGLGLAWQATEALSALGSDAGVEGAKALARTVLMKGADNNAYMRMASTAALGNMRDVGTGAGPYALSTALIEDNDVNVRRNSAKSLGQLGGDVVGTIGASALAKALKDDHDISVRCFCADSIGQLGQLATCTGVNALNHAIDNDPDMNVRWRAVRAMGSLGHQAGEAGAAGAMRAYKADKTVIVQNHAKTAVQVLRASAVECLRKAPDEEQSDSRSYLRGRAAWVLGQLGDMCDEEAVEELVKAGLQAGEDDAYVRRRAMEALGVLGVDAGPLGAVAVKRAAIEDDDVYAQWQAADVLQELCKMDKNAEEEALAKLDKLLGGAFGTEW